MKHFYLDTNPLLRWAEAKRPETAEARCLAVSSALETMLADRDAVLAASEITLIEFHSNVHVIWRDEQPKRAPFNTEWLREAQAALMRLVQSDELHLLRLSPKAFELAMRYITIAAREHGRHLDSWDAVHIHQAERWARTVDSQVTFVSHDRQLRNFFDLFPEFGEHLDLLDLETDGYS